MQLAWAKKKRRQDAGATGLGVFSDDVSNERALIFWRRLLERVWILLLVLRLVVSNPFLHFSRRDFCGRFGGRRGQRLRWQWRGSRVWPHRAPNRREPESRFRGDLRQRRLVVQG